MNPTIQVERLPLVKAYETALKAVLKKPKENENKNLASVKITIDKQILTLTSGDGMTGMEIDLPIIGNTTSEKISFIPDKKTFRNIIKNFNVPLMFIELIETEDGYDLSIYNDRDIIHTTAQKADQYPSNYKVDKMETLLTLDFETVQAIKKEVAYCASKDDFRLPLRTVHFTSSDYVENQNKKRKTKKQNQKSGYFIAEATDAYKLARKEFKDLAAKNLNVMVSASLFNYALLFDKDQPIKVKSNGWSTILECGNKRLICSIPAEGYPNIDRILPSEYDLTLTVRASELMDKLNFGAKMIGGECSVCKFAMNDAKNEVSLNYYQKGGFSSEMQLYDYLKDGPQETFNIAFNGTLMLEVLKANNPDFKVKLGFISEKKPIQIQIPEKDNLTTIIVPLRSSR